MPLETGLRRDMEQGFGADFSRVRIHRDAGALELNRKLSSHAFTYGTDIYFNHGKFDPGSSAGRRLLAHELTHVVQQSHSTRAVQKKGEERPVLKHRGAAYVFRVKIKGRLSREELLRAFLKQRNPNLPDAKIDEMLPQWSLSPNTEVTDEDVQQSFKRLIVIDYSQYLRDLSPEEKAAVDQETDERYWALHPDKEGKKITKGDKDAAQEWLGLQATVAAEKEKKEAIAALPDSIKTVLFSGDGPNLSPADYDVVLRLAERLAQLSENDLADYKSRVNATTSSWSEMERSIEAYVLDKARKEKISKTREAAAAKLIGLDEVYKLYRLWLSNDPQTPFAGEVAAEMRDARLELEAKMLPTLRAHDFNTVADFADALTSYRNSFRDQTVSLALDVLAKYEHLLFEERKKFEDKKNAEALAQALAGTKSVAQYDEARQKVMTAAHMYPPAGGTGTTAYQEQLYAQARDLRTSGAKGVIEASGNDPIIKESHFDQEALVRTPAADVQRHMLDAIDLRYAQIKQARDEFHDDPDRVFKLDSLIDASLGLQQIAPDSIYELVVRDYIKDEGQKHLFSQLAITALLIMLAVLVPGGGWVAAIALASTAAISTVQAYQALQEYREQSVDASLGFLSDDPSFAWVVVAIGAAALDIGVAVGPVLRVIGVLEKPLKAFKAGGPLEALQQSIERAEKLDPAVKLALQKAAAAQRGVDEATVAVAEAVRASRGRLNSLLLPFDPDVSVHRLVLLYRRYRAGVTTLEHASKDAALTKALGDLSALSGLERAELTEGFSEIKRLATLGDAKGMDDATTLRFIRQWGSRRGEGATALQAIEKEMSRWRPPTARQLKALKGVDDARDSLALLEQRRNEIKAKLKAGVKTPDNKPDLEEIGELRKELAEIEGPSVFDPRSQARKPDDQGLIRKAREGVEEAEKVAAAEMVDPVELMRRAFDKSAERANALKGVTKDPIGPLKTEVKDLTVDHIVSMKRISAMEGFEKLSIQERNTLANWPDNLTAMDASANFSKGERSWREWAQCLTFYDETAKSKMLIKEIDVSASIRAWIAKMVRGR